MANLAIRGHATRGKEVVEILEMLGGKSYTGLAYKGEDPSRLYCINNENNFIDSPLVLKDVQIFSLEKFLEKFPYKVGDKAFAFGNKCTIIDAVWDKGINEVVYTIKLDTNKYTTTKLSNQLQPYKEEAMDKIKIDIPKGYEFVGVDADNQQVVFEKTGRYPKTYEECCDVLKIGYPYFKTEEDGISASTYKNKLFGDLKQLLICRDAYWKLAGEQMGLNEPWEPDTCQIVYSIGRDSNRISFCNDMFGGYFIFEFPTEEMRDAFYENFKDLIEQCKELL